MLSGMPCKYTFISSAGTKKKATLGSIQHWTSSSWACSVADFGQGVEKTQQDRFNPTSRSNPCQQNWL